MARTRPLSVARLAQCGTGMSVSLVHTSKSPALLLVEAGLRDLRIFSTEHEKISFRSDRYNCSLQSVMLGYCNALGELLTVDHWRVLVSSVSTADNPSPPNFVLPPATIRWVRVVIVAGRIRGVGIGGRSSSHFVISKKLLDKQRRVLVAVPLSQPPVIVSCSFTTAMLKC